MAQSPRLTALQKLSSQIPVANARVAQGQQAARDLQLQQAVKQAPSSMGTQQAQQIGAQQAAAAGQQQLATQEAGIQQQAQVGQLAAQATQQQQQGQMAGLEQGLEKQRQDNLQKFANLSEQAKQEMFDSRMQFQRDEMGRLMGNERQLADYARLTAQNDEQYRTYAQQAQQAHEMKIQSLETINRRLQAAMQDEAIRKQEGLDRLSQQQILQMQRDVERQMQQAKADAAKKTAMWGAIGTVGGAVAGGLIGGPAGAAAGASMGGGLATVAATS